MIWAQADGIADKIPANLWLYVAIGAGLLFPLYILYKIATGRKKLPDLETGLRENLAEYPPPPTATSSRLVAIDGIPARLRLVVVAPVGKQQAITLDDVPALLDNASRGLGSFLKTDKPRIKVWPPQLSMPGFAPSFHRLVSVPSPKKWIKVAGVAKQGRSPFLLGLVFLAEEPSDLGELNLDANEWAKTIQAR
jgi:hypothetical protein